MNAKLKSLWLIVVLLFFSYSAHAVESDAKPEARLEAQCEAETTGKKKEKKTVESVLSFDLGFFLRGLMNKGIALGMNYERLVVGHFSLRGMAGAMFFSISNPSAYCLGITTSVFANWYPMSEMLDKFYAGLGLTADFLNYFGEGQLPSPPRDTLVSVAPLVGWKQNIANVVMLDFYTAYSFIVFNTQRFRSTEDYIRNGVQLGVRFKVLWRPQKGRR